MTLTIDTASLTADELLHHYRQGLFPWGEGHAKPMEWYSPDMCKPPELRGVMPIADFHIPNKMKQLQKRHPYEITVDQDFNAVIHGCAEITGKTGRDETWITPNSSS